jgi:hypothetical protein
VNVELHFQLEDVELAIGLPGGLCVEHVPVIVVGDLGCRLDVVITPVFVAPFLGRLGDIIFGWWSFEAVEDMEANGWL